MKPDVSLPRMEQEKKKVIIAGLSGCLICSRDTSFYPALEFDFDRVSQHTLVTGRHVYFMELKHHVSVSDLWLQSTTQE